MFWFWFWRRKLPTLFKFKAMFPVELIPRWSDRWSMINSSLLRRKLCVLIGAWGESKIKSATGEVEETKELPAKTQCMDKDRVLHLNDFLMYPTREVLCSFKVLCSFNDVLFILFPSPPFPRAFNFTLAPCSYTLIYLSSLARETQSCLRRRLLMVMVL